MTTSIFTLEQAKKYDIPGGICYLYPDSPTERLSAAFVKQDGRYPTEGYRKNERCTEALFILNGELTIYLAETPHQLKPKDVVYIPPGTPYAIEGKGEAFVFIEPKWDSTQNTQV